MAGPENQRPFRLGMGLIAGRRLADIAEATITLAQKCSGILAMYPVEGHCIEQRKVRKKAEKLRKGIEMDAWIDVIEGDITVAEDRKDLVKAIKGSLGRTQRLDIFILNSQDPSEDLDQAPLRSVVDDIRPYMGIGGKITLNNGELELATSKF